MKLLIVGSRDFNDYDLLKSVLDDTLQNKTDIEIISGGAKGADNLAERYAKDNGYACRVFIANWDKYGKRAGYVRNAEMHKYISEYNDRLCIAFWDGISKGTQHSFSLAQKYHNPLKVVNYIESIKK